MAKKSYVVMGATGQIGHVVVEYLLQKGHAVKALGRHPEKLDFLKKRGAQIIALQNFEDVSALTGAFNGADGIFGMIPPGQGVEDYGAYQDRVGEAIKAALEKNSVRYLVSLSSLGAHLPEGTGPIKGLYRQEQRLKTLSNVHIIHLRPSFFMENLMWSFPVLLDTGTLKSPLDPKLSLPLVATPDIGVQVGDFLNRSDFQGHTVFEYVGPRSLNMIEVAKILGSAIGKPDLKYIQFSYDEIKQGMVSSGMSPGMADLILEMYTAMNEGKCSPTQKLGAENHGKTTLEQFAQFFANEYRQAVSQKAPA